MAKGPGAVKSSVMSQRGGGGEERGREEGQDATGHADKGSMTKSDVSTQYTDTNSIPAHVMTLSVPPSLPLPPFSFFISLLDSLLCNSSHTRSARASPPFRTPLLHPPPLQRAASTPLCVRGAPPPPPLSAHLLLHESCFTAHVPTYPSPPPPCNESFTPSEALRLGEGRREGRQEHTLLCGGMAGFRPSSAACHSGRGTSKAALLLTLSGRREPGYSLKLPRDTRKKR